MQKKVVKLKLKDVSKPEFKKVVYSLPLPMQLKYQRIYINKNNLDKKWDDFEIREFDYEFKVVILIILLFVAEIFCVAGLFLWYYKEKHNNDELEDQKRLKDEILATNCQSCYKAFIFTNERGTNQNGSLSNYFCGDCFLGGAYTEPDLSFLEAKTRLKSKMEGLKYTPRKIKKTLNSFEDLTRWKRQKVW